MDPLSVTVSAITIITLTTDLIIWTQDYFQSVKTAPKEIAELVDELIIMSVVLENLRNISQKVEVPDRSQIGLTSNSESQQKASQLPMLKKMMEANGPLTICYKKMLSFKTKLTKDQSKIKKSLKWPFEKDEIMVVVSRLRSLKSVLDTAIASDQ
jgi:hypothetical protein